MLPINFINTNTTRKFLILFLSFYFPLFIFGNSGNSRFDKKLVRKWTFVTTKLANIVDHSNVNFKPLSIDFKEDHTYILINTEKGLKYNGRWKYDQKTNKLHLIKEGNKNPKSFEIIKCNKNDLVIKGYNTKILFTAFKKPQTFFGRFLTRFRGILGVIVLIFIAFLFSNNKRKINWSIPIKGLILQILIAIAVLKIALVSDAFGLISRIFVKLLTFSQKGASFIFNDLVDKTDTFGYIFAFQILPTVIFFSALTSVLYYYGILQKVVYGFAWVMNKLMKLSGAESLAAAANIFIGQTEAPLVIKPYVPGMTKSEIMALMCGGMATIAGGVLAAYIGFLGGQDPAQQELFAKHLLIASIMNAPASLFLAKILVPETEQVERKLKIAKDTIGKNILDALAKGTTQGLKLAVNIGAMLLVFVALMALLNYIVFRWIGQPTGLNELILESSGGQYKGLNLQYILGMVFAPVAWLIGIPDTDIVMIGQLLGEKTILNEFYAYTSMKGLKDAFLLTDRRSIIIATYALCGFANFSSIGIQIGGIGVIAPNQRILLSKLGLRALLGGTIASLLTASIAGMII